MDEEREKKRHIQKKSHFKFVKKKKLGMNRNQKSKIKNEKGTNNK